MVERFDGKVIMVTGASSGIGKATAVSLARAGAKVVLADLRDSGDVATEICSSGGAAIFASIDVVSEASVAAAVSLAVETYGALDGAANCAGISAAPVPLAEVGADDWRRVLSVDLDGVFYCLKHQIRIMLAHGGRGAIVNVSSALGATGAANMAAYVAAKHGVAGLTKAAAIDYAKAGIRINAVMPGMINTPMVTNAISTPGFEGFLDAMVQAHPVGRLGEASEISETIGWLLSDAASFVTGATVFADGGYSAI